MFDNALWRGVRVVLLLVCTTLILSPLAFGDDLAADPSDVATKDQALGQGHLPPAAEDVVREGIMRAYAQPQAQQTDPGNNTDFADLGRTDAASLFSSEQPDVVHGEGWADPDPNDQAQSITLLDPSAASVTAQDGSTSVAVSSEPMGFPTPTGALKQIDLDLHSVADGFEADASPVTTVLPDSTADPIQLGSGDTALSVSPAGAAVIGVQRDSGVFYANIANDLDFFVKPVLGGVETYHFLRSVQSPEDLTVDVTGPAPGDSELVAGTEHTAVVQIGDNKPWTISPVTATDADGTDVPVTVTYYGDRMKIHVAHRDKDFAYPITVDPTISLDGSAGAIQDCWNEVKNHHNGCQIDAWEGSGSSTYNSMLWGPGGTNGGWSYWTSAPGRMANFAGDAYLGRGLYIRTLIAGNYTAWSDAAYWTLTAPPETRITKAYFTNLSTDNWGDNASCSFVGIIENNNTWSAGGPWYIGGCAQQTLDTTALSCEGNNCNAALGGTYQNWAVFGADIRHTGATNGFAHDMGAAVIYMHDDVGPRLGELARTDNNSPYVADIEDWGLGLKSWNVSSPGNALWGQGWNDNTGPGCSGGIGRLACPRAFTPSIGLCGLPPGLNTINMTAKDVSGNLPSNPHTGTVNVHAGMTALSGSFFTTPNRAFATNESVTLHTEAQDPCGIYAMTAKIDDSQTRTPTLYGTGTADWTINLSGLSAGTHTMVINAQRKRMSAEPTDPTLAPFLDERRFTFTIGTPSANYGGADHVVNLPEEAETLGAALVGTPSLFSQLATAAEKNYMMAGGDSRYASWVRNVDHTAPAAVSQIDTIDVDSTAHTASVLWNAGDDPDLQVGVQGSGPDPYHEEFRYQRPGGAMSQWYSADDGDATFTSVSTGDVVGVDVREYDQAGNVSPITHASVTIPPVTASTSQAAEIAGGAMLCALGGCEGLMAAAAVVGTVAVGAVVVDQVHWDVRKTSVNDHISIASPRLTSADTGDGGHGDETFDDYQTRGHAQRGSLRAKLGLKPGDPEQAHHIIPVGGKAGEYLRKIMYKCGIDLNDEINGVALPPEEHYKTYPRRYINALDKLLHRRDPDATISPCDWLRDDSEHGLRATLKKIAELLASGKFPY